MRSPALRVAAPCPLRWEEMAGDDRVRFCGQCQQHVYNVERLTPGEVRALVERREGRVCVRLQRRADGTVITRDCWYAVRRARERLVATGLGLAAAAVAFWSGVGLLRCRFQPARRAALSVCVPPPPPPSLREPVAEESDVPDWLRRGAERQQGPHRRSKLPRRLPPPPPPEPRVTLGVLMPD